MEEEKKKNIIKESKSTDVESFLAKVAQTPVVTHDKGIGRLIFSLDATASREPTWDIACNIQAEMFSETTALGQLRVQLAYYRGFGEFNSGLFLENSQRLLTEMLGVYCLGGRTQIKKVLQHSLVEHMKERVNAVIFVGDACEENTDELCHIAGVMGMRGLPIFAFHEGNDLAAKSAFEQIARLSGGAYCRFDSGSAKVLRDLLAAVAVYAVGGRSALEMFNKRAGRTMLRLSSNKNF